LTSEGKAHNPEGEVFGFPRLRALVAEHGEEERSLEDFLLEELYSLFASLRAARSRRTMSPSLPWSALRSVADLRSTRLLACGSLRRARAPNRQTSATSTSGSSPTVAEKRSSVTLFNVCCV
jgi:hypothetical protein